MDNRVSWSPAALDDVDAIAEYISRDSPAYARAVVVKIRDTASKPKDFPSAGRVVPELEDETIRERFIYSDLLIYRIEKSDHRSVDDLTPRQKRQLADIVRQLKLRSKLSTKNCLKS